VIPGVPHHITQRGNYRQKVFFREEDHRFYINLLRDYSRHHGVSILAYCLMPNHVHLIAVPHEPEALSRLLQRVHGDYARATHLRLRRTGHLWQSRFHSVPMDDEHFWYGMIYVEQNPVRAGLADQAESWRWSSAAARLAGRDEGLLDLVRWRSVHTPESWKRCLSLGLRDAMLLERIRDATLTGWPLGGDEFLDRLECLGFSARRGKPGPKPPFA
jgi:putative transposase